MLRRTGVCFQTGSCPGAADPFIRWTYDGVGNRLTEQRPSGTTNYSYDDTDRLLTAGSTSYTYDRNGNQLSGGGTALTYDLANRLKTAAQGSTTTTYAYNGDGVRLQASTGSQASKKTNFLWDVNNPLPELALERNGSDALLRRYINGHRPVSMWTSSTIGSYYHYDPLGSVRDVTSNSGATQLTYDYEPYGTVRTQTGSSPANLLKFTGEYHDPTGLYHLRARQYDPVTGRMLTVDPVESATKEGYTSQYVYSGNRPTVMVDPSGRTFAPSDAGQASAFASASPVEVRTFADAADCSGSSRMLAMVGPENHTPVNGCGPGGWKRRFVPEWFKGACNAHDRCYGRWGSVRRQCDDQFKRAMLEQCRSYFWGRRHACNGSAETYYQAVRRLGRDVFIDNQVTECLVHRFGRRPWCLSRATARAN